jgi:Mn-containing catalase
MFDFNTFVSDEIRHLAFRKASEQANWQEAIKEARVSDAEFNLGAFSRYNFVTNLARTLFQHQPWRRAHHLSSGLISDTPSRNKAG